MLFNNLCHVGTSLCYLIVSLLYQVCSQRSNCGIMHLFVKIKIFLYPNIILFKRILPSLNYRSHFLSNSTRLRMLDLIWILIIFLFVIYLKKKRVNNFNYNPKVPPIKFTKLVLLFHNYIFLNKNLSH